MIIKKHDFVLIDDGLKYRLHKIVDTKIKIKKNYINLLFLVNKKYGSTFTFINNKWVRSKKSNSKLDIDYYTDIKGTNKDIYDSNDSQKLTEENIAELKKMNCEDPYDIIQKLIDNSSTFKEKTVISKFKYIEKKLKRHLCQFTVYECNIANLTNFYYKYFPEKISYVRIDYLANILFHLNNVVCTNKYLYNKENEMLIQKENSFHSSYELNSEKANDGNNEDACLDKDIFLSPNVLIYDDSFGLLTSVLNIYYNYNVNIFSLVYKNSCNSIIPSFGIKKKTNIVKINILNSHMSSKSYNCFYFDDNLGFISNFENNLNFKEKENQHFLNSCNIDNREEENENKNEEDKNQIEKNNLEKNNIENKDQFEVESCNHNDICKEDSKKRKISTPNNNKEINNFKKNKNNENDTNMVNELANSNNLNKNLLYNISERKAEAFVIILSGEFMDNTKTDVNLLIGTLINISLKYLKNDSKIIIHTDDLNLSNFIMQLLISTNSFINIKLNEYILREQQVIKRRTHPIIKNSKLADGFLLTALKIQN